MKRSRRPRVGLALAAAACFQAMAAACGGGATGDLARLRARNAELEGRWDWARLYHQEDRRRHPERLEALRGEGFAWLAGYQQSWSEGARLLEEYLARREDEKARLQLIATLTAFGELDRAGRAAEKLPAGPLASYWRAEIARGRDPAAAASLVEAALAGGEGLAEGTRAKAHLLAATLAEERGEPAKARAHAERAGREAPLDPGAYYLLGRLARRDGRPEEARAAFARHEQLRLLSHDGTLKPLPPAEALKLMRELEPEVGDDFDFRRRLLDLLFANGELAEAERLLGEVVADRRCSDRDLAEAAARAGLAGLAQVARGLFEELLRRDPKNVGAVSSLALLEIERGELAAAQDRLEAALLADPGVARYHALLARVATARDAAAFAESHHRRALELAPWSWPWRHAHAQLLLALGRGKEACALAREASELPPGADAFFARLAKLGTPCDPPRSTVP